MKQCLKASLCTCMLCVQLDLPLNRILPRSLDSESEIHLFLSFLVFKSDLVFV